MRPISIIRFLTAGAALLLTACMQEELSPESAVGQPVNFGAYTESASPATKTVYSGVVDGSMERINWVSDDRIRVMCGQVSWPGDHAYNYYLQPDHTSGKLGYASLNPHGSAHGLLWGEGSHTFYAMYPAPTGPETGISVDSGGALVWANLPADQSCETPHTLESDGTYYYGNMDLAYMVAANSSVPSNNPVVLPFFPIVTTFYVTITNTTGETMTLRRVELSSSTHPMIGSYSVRISSIIPLSEGDLPSTTARNFSEEFTINGYGPMNSSVYANFDGLSIPAERSVTVALFAVPLLSNPLSNVTLSVTSDETGTVSRPLTEGSSETPMVFAGEKKHNIVNIRVPEVDYDIHVDEGTTTISYGADGIGGVDQTFHVTSTKTVVSNTTAAPWKTQIKVSNTGNELVDWVDMTAANRPSWLQNYPLNSTEAGTITADGQATICKSVTAPEIQSHIDHLKEGKIYEADGVTVVDNSLSTNAVDLSYYDFVTHRMEPLRTTANTYIISAPGWYKFPMVYGNAIENSVDPVTNTYKGKPAGLIGDIGHLNEFKKARSTATGADIDDSWLESGYYANVQLLWQKFTRWENDHPVHTGMNLRTSGTDNLRVITQLGVVIENAKPYIQFYVNPNNIQPGCAVLASVGTNFLTWSWMIWITDQDMEPVNVTNSSGSYDVLPVNLGWTDDTKGLHFPESTATLRFVNIAGGIERCTSEEVIIRQSGKNVPSTSGWQPYYQWGRKDPFVDKLFTYDDDDELHDVWQDPDCFRSDGHLTTLPLPATYYYDWSQNNYNNMWDSQLDQYGSMGTSLPNMKTVYDPSPRKYCVSPENAWERFSTSEVTGSFNGGYQFNTGNGTDTIFFPASGYLRYSDGALTDNGNYGYYWTYHPIGTATTRTSYALYFLNGTVYTPNNGSTVHHRAYGYSVRPVKYQ